MHVEDRPDRAALRVRQWIVGVLEAHPEVLCLAVQQRAKFERWLKFELATAASRDGATDVRVEVPLPACSDRGDLGFTLAR